MQIILKVYSRSTKSNAHIINLFACRRLHVRDIS